jgi:dCMP deaminase
MKRISWDSYYIRMAKLVAKRSACLSRQVGCVLVDSQHRVLSTGYNGPPRGVDHCKVCTRKNDKGTGRSLYDCHSVHAEMNAIMQCRDVDRVHMAYVSVSPCLVCARLLFNAGCKVIVFAEPYDGIEEVANFFEVDGRLMYQVKR